MSTSAEAIQTAGIYQAVGETSAAVPSELVFQRLTASPFSSIGEVIQVASPDRAEGVVQTNFTDRRHYSAKIAADPQALAARMSQLEKMTKTQFDILRAEMVSLRSALATTGDVPRDEPPAGWPTFAPTGADHAAELFDYAADTGSAPDDRLLKAANLSLISEEPILRAAAARAVARFKGASAVGRLNELIATEQNSYVRSVMAGALRAAEKG